MAEDHGDLWSRFRKGDVDARQALIVAYLPLVKRVVGRLSINLPAFIDRGDLEGAAVLGLIDAIGGYRSERAVKFETYAVARIRGAALDSLRSLDFVPRSVRQKAKLLQATLQELGATLGREPDHAELARTLGISEAELHNWWQDVQAITVLPLDAPLDGEDTESHLEMLADASVSDPLSELLEAEGVTELATAISGLNQREQQLLSLYYDQGLTLRELGNVLGVSESRACQIHTAAIIKLRARLADREVMVSGKHATG